MILITGAGGFIGSHLVARCQSEGKKVIPLKRSSEFSFDPASISMDLTNPVHFEALKKQEIVPNTVIHLAGRIEISLKKPEKNPLVSAEPGQENLFEIYHSNVIPTINLLDYCLEKGVKHFIFASSQAVYGLPQTELLTEDSPLNPLEHYAMSKVCCEQILRLASSGGLPVSILRFPGIFSEVRTSGTVYRFCRDAVKKHKITVEADFPLPYDVLHLEDVLNAFMRVVSQSPKGSSTYNFGTGEPGNLNLLADRIATLVPGTVVEHCACSQPVIRMDSGRAKKILGWVPVPLNKRLMQVLDTIEND